MAREVGRRSLAARLRASWRGHRCRSADGDAHGSRYFNVRGPSPLALGGPPAHALRPAAPGESGCCRVNGCCMGLQHTTPTPSSMFRGRSRLLVAFSTEPWAACTAGAAVTGMPSGSPPVSTALVKRPWRGASGTAGPSSPPTLPRSTRPEPEADCATCRSSGVSTDHARTWSSACSFCLDGRTDGGCSCGGSTMRPTQEPVSTSVPGDRTSGACHVGLSPSGIECPFDAIASVGTIRVVSGPWTEQPTLVLTEIVPARGEVSRREWMLWLPHKASSGVH